MTELKACQERIVALVKRAEKAEAINTAQEKHISELEAYSKILRAAIGGLREAHKRLKAIIGEGGARGRPMDLIPKKDWDWYIKAEAALNPSEEGGEG